LCAISLRWNDRRRATGVVYGLLLTLGWIGALRFALKIFWISPVLPWACCILTVASAVFVQRSLDAAAAATDVRDAASRGTVPATIS